MKNLPAWRVGPASRSLLAHLTCFTSDISWYAFQLSKNTLPLHILCSLKVHIVATLSLDLQPFYPPALVPGFMSDAHASYLKDTGDPLIKAFLGLLGEEARISASWFESFIYCEAYVFPYSIFHPHSNHKPQVFSNSHLLHRYLRFVVQPPFPVHHSGIVRRSRRNDHYCMSRTPVSYALMW